MEVLGALASVLSIWLVTGVLVYEAVNRILNPVPVNDKSATLSRSRRPRGARMMGLNPLRTSSLSDFCVQSWTRASLRGIVSSNVFTRIP